MQHAKTIEADGIREYVESDAYDFVELCVESNSKGQSFLPPLFWRDDAQVFASTYLPQADTWLYEESGKLSACISLFGDEILGLFVSPDRWRHGLGTVFVEFAKDFHSELYVKVFKQNARAIKFFQKNGFAILEEEVCSLTGMKQYVLFWVGLE